jgi:hypothetical protein
MSEYTDWLGQTIEVGSPVLYAVSNGHYAQVVWAEVIAITPVEPKHQLVRNSEGRYEEGEEYYPYNRKFKLKVQPYYQSSPGDGDRRAVETKWATPDGKWSQGAQLLYERVLPKQVTVQNVEKVTVFPLPDGVREAMEERLRLHIESENIRLAEVAAKRAAT